MITHRHIKDGKVALWEAFEDGHRKVHLTPVDAAHALQADPERWSLPEHPDAPPPAKPEPKLTLVPDGETEETEE